MLMLSQGPFPGQQAVGETAMDDETELLEDHDISSVSTISKASSNLTDIDGQITFNIHTLFKCCHGPASLCVVTNATV